MGGTYISGIKELLLLDQSQIICLSFRWQANTTNHQIALLF